MVGCCCPAPQVFSYGLWQHVHVPHPSALDLLHIVRASFPRLALGAEAMVLAFRELVSASGACLGDFGDVGGLGAEALQPPTVVQVAGQAREQTGEQALGQAGEQADGGSGRRRRLPGGVVAALSSIRTRRLLRRSPPKTVQNLGRQELQSERLEELRILGASGPWAGRVVWMLRASQTTKPWRPGQRRK